MFEIHIGESEVLELPEHRPGWCWLGGSVERVGGAPLTALITEEALAEIHRQAAACDNEVCGLLLGQGATWQGRYTLEITAAIAGQNAEAGPTHVTMSSETWSAMLREQENHFPELTILGWYHSHPRMGIFSFRNGSRDPPVILPPTLARRLGDQWSRS